MNEALNILLIRLKSIGDIVFTLPAVGCVRDNFPESRIAFLVSKEFASLLQGFAEVDEVIPLDRAPFQRKQLKAICAETLGLVRRLRAGRFALVIDFQGYGETAAMTWLTRAPQRWGSVYRPSRRWAYTKWAVRNDRLHPADWNLSLVTQCGLKPGTVRNEFRLPDSARNAAREFFAAHGLDATKATLFIQPFTSSPQKDWPLEKSLALGRHWKSQGLQVILGGGPAERAALEPARQASFVTSAGVPLLTTAGLVELSTLVVGGVTGLLHLAVAMQKRVVMLIGYAEDEPGFPYQHRDWAVVAGNAVPADSIPVEAVIDATTKAFAAAGLTLPSRLAIPV